MWAKKNFRLIVMIATDNKVSWIWIRKLNKKHLKNHTLSVYVITIQSQGQVGSDENWPWEQDMQFYLSDASLTSNYTHDISVSKDKLQSKHLFTALPTRPVYPLQVFWVLQPAKKCNLWPKSVIVNTLPASSSAYSLTEWHDENLDNWVRDTTCVLNKNKFSRWGGLSVLFVGTTFKLQDNIQATETVCATQHVYTTMP